MAFSFSGIFVAPFVGKITQKFGKKEAGSVSLIVAGSLYVLAYFLQIRNPLIYVGLVLVSSLSMGYYMMATYSYVTDVIVDYQIKTNEKTAPSTQCILSSVR
nr:MFS transporter [Atopococcus tabaci]